MTERRRCYRAEWVLPVSSKPLRDAQVLVGADGRIERVAPKTGTPLSDDVEIIDLGHAALLPGLVNVHSHPELCGFRGLLDDLPFEAWIPTLNAIKRDLQPSAEEYGLAARWTCIESIRNGITTIGATEDSGAALDACNDAGMRGLVYREVFGPAPEQAKESIASLRQKVSDMRKRESELVRVGISPHAAYTVSDALFELAADMALNEGLPLAVHAAEAQVEDQLVREGTGTFAEGLQERGIATPPRARSTIALLERTRILATAPLLIHCVRVDPADISLMAAHGVRVAHCPVANARLGHGIAPVLEMLDAGVPLGIGTDSVASNNRQDLLEEARIAQIAQRARLQSSGVLPATLLLRLVTIEGAKVLGLGGRVGTLEVGKDADLCAVSFAGAASQPTHDPLATLFHSARGTDVTLTVVRGRILYRDGHVHTLDERALAQPFRQFSEKLRDARRRLAAPSRQ
jgi:cytosine/adenosine deaminase-related metal-dependent hydrolase